MKRSEILSEIYQIIHCNNPEYGGGWESDVAESILNRIEALGMLPPINNCDLISDGKGGFKHSASKREWDDEDSIS